MARSIGRLDHNQAARLSLGVGAGVLPAAARPDFPPRPGTGLCAASTNLSLLAADLFTLALSVWLAFETRGILLGNHTIPQLAIVVLPIWAGSAWLEGLYPGWGLPEPEYARRLFRAVATTFLVCTSVLSLAGIGPGWEQVMLLLASAVALALIPTSRWLVRSTLLRANLWGVPAVILGAGETGRALARGLKATPHLGYRAVAFYDDDPDKAGLKLEGLPVLPRLEAAAAAGTNVAFIAIPSLPKEQLLNLLHGPLRSVRNVTVVPDMAGLSPSWAQARQVKDILTLEIQRHLLRPEARFTKRALDLIGATLLALPCLPVFLIIALAIALDSRGPVFYRHERIGRGGRRLRLWKFRTMHRNADDLLERHLNDNPNLRQEWEAKHKLHDDPRITRVGHWLRKTSLDELPQVINVLCGEMSLVGPRPIVADEIDKYGRDYPVYTEVVPGMTGLWQISGRNNTTYEERVSLDVTYIHSWSVWLDVVILSRTPAAVLSKRGAY